MAEEKNFENKVKKFLKDEGCWYVKYWAGGGPTKKGIPDILACCNGFFLGIEVKATRGHASELQLWNIKKIREAGGFSIVLYPDDFERFKQVIQDLNGREFHSYAHAIQSNFDREEMESDTYR